MWAVGPEAPQKKMEEPVIKCVWAVLWSALLGFSGCEIAREWVHDMALRFAPSAFSS